MCALQLPSADAYLHTELHRSTVTRGAAGVRAGTEPVEPVWSNLKRSLANLVRHDISQVTALVKTRLRRMQYRPGLLQGFLAKPGLDLTTLQ